VLEELSFQRRAVCLSSPAAEILYVKARHKIILTHERRHAWESEMERFKIDCISLEIAGTDLCGDLRIQG
jgi:hypothetical protein